MTIDTDDPAIQCCIRGIDWETRDHGQAAACFREAWALAGTPMNKCVAAHYLAKHQPDMEQELHWNLVALGQAALAPAAVVSDWLPSLYLNAANSYRQLGDHPAAHTLYDKALACCSDVANDPYSRMIRSGIERGRRALLTEAK